MTVLSPHRPVGAEDVRDLQEGHVVPYSEGEGRSSGLMTFAQGSVATWT